MVSILNTSGLSTLLFCLSVNNLIINLGSCCVLLSISVVGSSVLDCVIGSISVIGTSFRACSTTSACVVGSISVYKESKYSNSVKSDKSVYTSCFKPLNTVFSRSVSKNSSRLS